MPLLYSINPATSKKVGSVKISTRTEVKKKVEEAHKAKQLWKELGVVERTRILKPLYSQFLKRKEEIAKLVTKEIGKPITESYDDLAWDKDYFKNFLDSGKKYLKDEITYRDKKESHRIIYEPIGVAAVIVPWNYPFANFLWGVIPTLIAGNTVVMKHSEECPLSGQLVEDMMSKLKLPKGVFSEVYGDGKVGEMLVEQDVDLIWFTGSSAVGQKLFEIAGKKYVKAVLEMGGSNPCVIFEDVKISDDLIESLYFARYANCGQVCDSVKRLIVHKSLKKEVVAKLSSYLENVVVGNPENKETQIGPLVAQRQLKVLESQVNEAIDKGAKVVIGGKRPEKLTGSYYLPTILTNVRQSMKVWTEEVFGPVLPVVSFSTEDEAIILANDTSYGLGAKIYSRDLKRARRVASKIDAGCIDVNKGNHWLACNPFGGYKCSGVGREHGEFGFRELTQVKVVSIA